MALIYDMATGLIWNVVSLSWETPSSVATNTDYRTTLTDANGVGWYSAAFPTQLLGTTVQVVTYDTANMTTPIGAEEISPPDTGSEATATTSPAVVGVVNKGLLFLGIDPISSLLEDSEPAQRAAQIYNSVLDATLRSHHWKFATYVTTLALLSNETTPGWEYLYTYPSTCLKLRRIFDNTYCDPSLLGVGFVSYTFDQNFTAFYDLYKDILYRYKIVISPTTFTKSIAAHITGAYAEYTYRVTDPGMWDQYFSDAMSWNLAAQLAHILTGSRQLGTQALQLFSSVVSEAKRIDAEEDRNHHNEMSSFQRVRM